MSIAPTLGEDTKKKLFARFFYRGPLKKSLNFMIDSRVNLELSFYQSALPKNSDWISSLSSGNRSSSGQKPNFDAEPQNLEITVPIG